MTSCLPHSVCGNIRTTLAFRFQSKDHGVLQEDRSRLKDRANRSLVKFSKDKRKVLQFGETSPIVQHWGAAMLKKVVGHWRQ